MVALRTILLIDNDEACLIAPQGILKRLKVACCILLAQNGQQALSLIKALCRQEQCPELILLELNIPELDGFELLEQIQSSDNLSPVTPQIVFLNISTSSSVLVRASKYPLIDYIEKPLTKEKLVKYL